MTDHCVKKLTKTDHCNRRTILIGLCPKCPEIGASYRSRDFGALRALRGTRGTNSPKCPGRCIKQLPPGAKRLPSGYKKIH